MISKLKSDIRNGGDISQEYRDYLLCTEVFHCLPHELDNESNYNLDLYFMIYNLRKKEEFLNNKRQSQKK